MTAGITGATGALGRRLTGHLISQGIQVKLLVRPGKIPPPVSGDHVNVCIGDITQPETLTEFVKDLDVCYHLAAQVGSTDKDTFYRVNVTGTSSLCEAILAFNPSCRLVYSSSIVTLRVRWYNRFLYTHYTRSKYQAEKKVVQYRGKGLKTVIIYPGFIYGPEDNHVLPNIIRMFKKGVNFLIHGGEHNAPLIYIDDLVRLFHLAGVNSKAEGKSYVSVGSQEFGVHDFYRMAAKEFQLNFPVKVYPRIPLLLAAAFLENLYSALSIRSTPPLTRRMADILSLFFKGTNRPAFDDLGWKPEMPIEQGFREAVDWYRKNRPAN